MTACIAARPCRVLCTHAARVAGARALLPLPTPQRSERREGRPAETHVLRLEVVDGAALGGVEHKPSLLPVLADISCAPAIETLSPRSSVPIRLSGRSRPLQLPTACAALAAPLDHMSGGVGVGEARAGERGRRSLAGSDLAS